MEILSKAKNFLFRKEHAEINSLVAELREERTLLRAERERVSRLVPLPSDVGNLLRDTLNARLGELGICKAEESRDALIAQIQMLRRHLRQELAVNEYLVENQKEGVMAFNGLPLELRKTYFEKVDAKL